MSKNKHLTLEERYIIERSLHDRLSFSKIAELIGKDPSTVSKEVRNHYKVVERPTFNPCMHRKTCRHLGDVCDPCRAPLVKVCSRCDMPDIHCHMYCADYEEQQCPVRTRPPYVCNGCGQRRGCRLQRHFYDARYAQDEYEAVRSESRQGFLISREELLRIDAIITPLIRQGQSIHQICLNHIDEIMLDEKTIYNYIDAGILTVRNIDLPRKVRYRVRKKKKQMKIDKQCFAGREYSDLLDYLAEYPDTPVVEMDTVEGKKGGKVLLTLYFRSCSVLLIFLREANTARSVAEILEALYEKLGHEMFQALFPVILADRGSEFTDPLSLEFNKNGARRCRVFYCDPQRPDQKGSIEVAHEFIRRILPKGSDFRELTCQDVKVMTDHINSYKRRKLNGRSPYQLLSFLHGENVLDAMTLTPVPSDTINLTPFLLKK